MRPKNIYEIFEWARGSALTCKKAETVKRRVSNKIYVIEMLIFQYNILKQAGNHEEASIIYPFWSVPLANLISDDLGRFEQLIETSFVHSNRLLK